MASGGSQEKRTQPSCVRAAHTGAGQDQHIVEDLVDINWGPEEPAPRVTFDEIGSQSQVTAEALKTLVDAGILTPDEPTETFARTRWRLPARDAATERTTKA